MQREKISGALLGMAMGDAFALKRGALEFESAPGEWSGETALTFALAESLVRHGGWNPRDIVDRFRQWWDAGYWSCRDRAFGADRISVVAIRKRKGEPVDAAGGGVETGGLLRALPVGLFFPRNSRLSELAGVACKFTHDGEEAIETAGILGQFFALLMAGWSRDEILDFSRWRSEGTSDQQMLENWPLFELLTTGSFLDRGAPIPPSKVGPAVVLLASMWHWAAASNSEQAWERAWEGGWRAVAVFALIGAFFGGEGGLKDLEGDRPEELLYRKAIIRLSHHLFEGRLGNL